VEVRQATVDDLAGVAAVFIASDRAPWTESALAPRDDRIAYVALVDGRIIGAAKTHLHPEPDGDAPAGHYLGGLAVAPECRRQGVGSRLTRARLDWIWARAATTYYFTDERNTASIRLHEVLGFQPVARFEMIRGVTADHDGERLILFEASR